MMSNKVRFKKTSLLNPKIYYSILAFIFIIMMIGVVSASDYQTHKQNTDLSFSVTSNNASSCNVTNLDYPLGTLVINKQMSKYSQTYNITFNKSYFGTLGDYCFNIECIDSGNNVESGSVCRNITPSGFVGTLGFYIILMVVIVLIIILGFSFKEAWFIVIGGMALMMLGLYSINSGIADMKDMFMTWGVGLFEIAVGFILTMIAGNEKMDNG